MVRDALTLDVLSMVPGIAWPGIPSGRASQMLAIQFQLEQSQWLDPIKIRARQTRQLGILLRHAYETVPFYRQRLNACGLHPESIRSQKDWTLVPLLTRRDIQIAGRELHCQAGPKEHGSILTTVTSGSSGQPVTTLSTTVTRLFGNALVLRQHLWHRRDLTAKLATIRWLGETSAGGPDEASSQAWGAGTLEIVQTGPAVAFDIRTSVAEQADFLLKHDPAYLITYPSVVQALCEHFETSDRGLTRLREVRTFGEVLDPTTRAACKRVWNVNVIDNYSTQEVGEIAMQCPDHEHYHIQSESLLVEVLDDAGRECRPGEVGRVVITSLHNFAMPLIRYEIGDYAEVGEPCPCGRGLPVLTRIVGRQRNMFLLPDGRKVWPALELSEAEQATEMPPVQQFQLIQRTRSRLELLVVSPRPFTDEEQQLIHAWVDRSIGCRLDLKITYVEKIERGPTGKYEDFRCEVRE